MEKEQLYWHQFIKGDNAALGELYAELFEPLVFISFHYLKNNEVARDIVSDLFVNLLATSAMERNTKWSTVEKIKPYLVTATKYKSIDYLRKYKSHVNLAEHEMHPSTDEMNLFEAELLTGLSEEERALFQRHLDGYKNAEIANEYSISEKTVRNKLSLSRKKMANFMKTLLTFLL